MMEFAEGIGREIKIIIDQGGRDIVVPIDHDGSTMYLQCFGPQLWIGIRRHGLGIRTASNY